jgi:hypothetical protein
MDGGVIVLGYGMRCLCSLLFYHKGKWLDVKIVLKSSQGPVRRRCLLPRPVVL